MSGFVAKTLMFVVKSGIISPASVHLDNDDRDRLAMLHIKALCSSYYQNRKEFDPNWKATGTEVIALLSDTWPYGVLKAIRGF